MTADVDASTPSSLSLQNAFNKPFVVPRYYPAASSSSGHVYQLVSDMMIMMMVTASNNMALTTEKKMTTTKLMKKMTEAPPPCPRCRNKNTIITNKSKQNPHPPHYVRRQRIRTLGSIYHRTNSC